MIRNLWPALVGRNNFGRIRTNVGFACVLVLVLCIAMLGLLAKPATPAKKIGSYGAVVEPAEAPLYP